jgi:CRISPR-associated endonuclease/helicase Cas3
MGFIPKKITRIDNEAIPFNACPAKTYVGKDGITVPGRSVAEHCAIVGEVAKALIQRHPDSVKKLLFPEGSALIASAHDIGKVSPTFYEKLLSHCDQTGSGNIRLQGVDPSIESQWGGHAGVSELTARDLQVDRSIPGILGQHHGFTPSLGGLSATDGVFGGPSWNDERKALVSELKTILSVDWPAEINSVQARVISGLTTVADWIGSGRHFAQPGIPWKGKITAALDEAGLIPPAVRRGLDFGQVFYENQAPFTPSPVQTNFIDCVNGPGVYVLEAPMGLGKTEAALFAAYKMLDAGLASGIYFALPTQLTSNKIYDRFNVFLERILESERADQAILLHSGANLMQSTEMGEDAAPGGSWFHQNKRGILAPFAVGTIDQALMAVMNVKHGFVRAYGLAGKVVILDEVHSYDAYTGALLDALVDFLKSAGCIVIILSATLNSEKRSSLLGCRVSCQSYPLISSQPVGDCLEERPVDPPPSSQVLLSMGRSQVDAADEAVRRALEGQQVLWIENTVKEAQQAYERFMAITADEGVECGLIHSRFTPHDRQKNEEKWVSLFGKDGTDVRKSTGRILIGTQVLEQSLDIDGDFLVSRFCPTDMLLQRLGRLWRHKRDHRPEGSKCEAWIISPSLEEALQDPVDAFGTTAFVYDQYILVRALEVWGDIVSISLPDDIRSLIESTYSHRDETGRYQTLKNQLMEGTRSRRGLLSLQQMAYSAISQGGKTLPESAADTRNIEREDAQVLLMKSLRVVGEQTHVVLADGAEVVIPHKKSQLKKQRWKEIGVKLSRNICKVSTKLAPGDVQRKVMTDRGFHHCLYIGHPEAKTSEIQIGLMSKCGEVQDMWKNEHKNGCIYDPYLGYFEK